MPESRKDHLGTARQASAEGDWRRATLEFTAADRENPLGPGDLEGLAEAAQCAGQSHLAVDPLERAVRAYLEQDDRRNAARAAASLAQIHFERRELSVAKGWLSRAATYLSEEPESREHGVLKWISGRFALMEGDLEQAASFGQEAYRIGKSRKDPDVEALGLLCWGLSLLATGEVRRGIDLQDEAAAAVLGGGVSPRSGSLVYCGVIWGCLSRGDWRRASEWTDQFERWCGSHGLTSSGGLCRLHRAEILTLRGELGEAEEEVSEAGAQLAESAPWAEGDALRVLGEIHLSKGNLDKAEAAFRRAHELGWEPQPGWAMMLLARGRVDAAVRSLERAVNDTYWAHRHRRGALLAYLAVAASLAGDTERAARAFQELDDHEELWSTPSAEATVLRARGELALAKGDVEGAVGHLRRSLQIWSEIGASLSAAEIRMRLAGILLETDPDAAELELSAAEAAYRKAKAPMRLERCREIRRTIGSRLSQSNLGKDRFHEADRLLDAALDLPAAGRGAFLDEKCGDDRELHDLVARLLREIDRNTSGGLATGSALEAFPDAFEELIPELSGTSVGRYEILREIGRGGMGVVYEGRDGKLDRRVAIKVLALPASDLATGERFEREARAAAALNHPNIVSIYDVGEASGRPYLVMELVAGTSLEERPPESLDEALAISRLVCEALEHAHGRGLVHRDLKPGNVLVVRDGGRLTVKLTDMGIALTRGAARVTRTGAIAGTPTYMAPEQALGQQVDGRADLYALGVMLYAWTAGRLPFEADDAFAIVSQHIHAPVVPPRTYRPDLPAGLEPVILRLLAKAPDLRFSSASEVRLALEAIGNEPAPGVPLQVAFDGLTRGRMVGREQELAGLLELWRGAVAGRAHMALISGEPGVGKTRLAHELTARARLEGARVLSGGCYENEATTPYLPFLEAFRRLVHDTGNDELGELLGDSRGVMALLAPEIEARLGPLPAGAVLQPQEERLRLFDHVARFLGRLARKKGLLFFIDDLQWADHGSFALLHYLLRHLGSERVMFLGTYREVELDREHALSRTLVDWNRERLVSRMRLERLGPEDTARMIRTLLGREEISREFAASLHKETEGNPFFVEEILKALIADGKIVHEKAGWRRQKTSELTLPQSVKAAIRSRLERVGEPTGEVLRTAAVLGKRFEFTELLSIARKPEDVLLDALDEAVAAQLVAPERGEWFAFTHDKIREVLYDELNPIRRRRLHLAIAEGLERLEADGKDVGVEDLAHHFVHSGDYEKGLVYADRAAQAALNVFAWEEAMSMLERARECAEALEREDEMLRIDEAMGDAAFAAGDVPAATEHYERAISASAREPDVRNRLRGKVGEAYVVSGDPRGEEHVRRALEDPELDRERLPQEAARAMMIQARYRHLRGELAQAVEMYLEAIELAKPLGDWSFLADLYASLAGTYQHLAEFDPSDAAAEQCIEIGRARNLPNGIMLGYEFLAENSLYRGWWHRQIELSEKEEALAIETHAGGRYRWAQLRAFSLYELGRLREALEMCRRGIADCQRSGDRRLELLLRGCHALCLTDLGDASQGEDEAHRAAQEADELNLVSHRITLHALSSYVLSKQDRVHEAGAEARAGLEVWQASGSKGTGLIYGAWLAEGLLRGGMTEEARDALAAHRVLAEAAKARHRLAQNHRVCGLLHAKEGREREAVAALDEAIVELEACESAMELVHALDDRAGLHRQAGRAAAADADLARAKAILERCGASPRIVST